MPKSERPSSLRSSAIAAERQIRTPEAEARGSVSLWEQARGYLAQHRNRLEAEQHDLSLGERYGASVVRSKIVQCGENFSVCVDAYLARRKATGRELNPEKTRGRLRELIDGTLYVAQEKVVKKLRKQVRRTEIRIEVGMSDEQAQQQLDRLQHELQAQEAKLTALPRGRQAVDARDSLLLQEATQEQALLALDTKIAEGLIDPESINANILLELQLENVPERTVTSLEEAIQATQQEIRGFTDKGYITPREASVILEHGERYARRFMRAFEKRFGDRTAQEAYEAMRDNARKVAFQTKVDKRTLAGSDHGTRHIYEGNTRFAEQLMQSLAETKDVDFKPRDEILIRQIIVDHDLGYTTAAAQTTKGEGAAKDHPCIGCRYVEANQKYYQQKFGKHGYEVVRDVLLNHSYPSSKYRTKRPAPTPDQPMTYNRQLIRSVVSTVDSIGVTAETKAMGLFRSPEAITILQSVRIYADAHSGEVDEPALRGFKDQLQTLVRKMVSEQRISEERASAYRVAIERKFSVATVQKTFGQFTGVIRDIRLVKQGKDEDELVPEVKMDLSRLQSLVAETFGDPVSLAGFKSAMEAFGVSSDEFKRLGKLVMKLRTEPDPAARKRLRKELEFVTDRARFIIGERETTGLPNEQREEQQAITTQFEALRNESIRSRLSDLFEGLRKLKAPRSSDMVLAVTREIRALLRPQDPAQAERMEKLCQVIERHAYDDIALEIVRDEFRTILARQEYARLAV